MFLINFHWWQWSRCNFNILLNKMIKNSDNFFRSCEIYYQMNIFTSAFVKSVIVALQTRSLKSLIVAFYLIRVRHQISCLIRESEQNNQLLFPLKWSENHRFSNDFRGNRSWLNCLNSQIRSETWRWSFIRFNYCISKPLALFRQWENLGEFKQPMYKRGWLTFNVHVVDFFVLETGQTVILRPIIMN